MPAPAAYDAELVAPATCEVGAPCAVTVRVACPSGSHCTLDPPGRLGEFEVLQVTDAGTIGAGRVQEWRLTLVAFEPGSLDVPALGVRIVRAADGGTTMASTPPASVDLRLAATPDDATLRPDAGPLDPGPDWRVVGAWGLALVAALAIVVLLWRWWRRRPRRIAPPGPAVSAAAAVAAIRELSHAPASTPADVLARYRGISDALRGYLGLPLDVPATALTSTELVDAIDGVRLRRRRRHPGPNGALPPLETEAHQSTRRLLERVDTVKFGGARPPDAERAGDGERAVELIEELERTREDATGDAGRVA